MEDNIAGAILAGGKNRRMKGINKAFIEIDGISILEKTLSIFKEIFKETFLITNSPKDFGLFEKDCRIITDIIKDIGPLGGMHSALCATSRKSIFFVACDMPFLYNGLIKGQIERFNSIKCEALIPRIGSSIEPLCGIYGKSLKDKIEGYISQTHNYSMKGFLESIDVSFFDLEDNEVNRRVFSNVNSPQDLERIKNKEPKA